MKNRIDRINDFLQWLSSAIQAKPDLNISENLVYANLTRLDIKEYDKINTFFNSWINNFKHIPNINVFVSENAKYFCQFTNHENDSNFIEGDFIKIYVPIDKDHIYNSANMLFEYMAINNIKHSSKIGSDVRFDDIVIRVKDQESATLIKNFIKNNKYIQEGLMPANPFAINDENIAIACDDRISYNSEVASYISDYLNDLRNTNRLNSANYNDFINYIINKYNNIFIFGEELDSFLKKRNITGLREDIKKKIINHMEVSQLIITALDKESNINNFVSHWNKIHDDSHKQSLDSHVDKKIDNYYKNKDMDKTEKIITISKIEEMLSSIINNTYSKYGLAQTKFALEKFINENDASAFTNTDNLRNTLKSTISGNEAKTLIISLLDGNYDVEEYISYAIQKNTLSYKQKILDNASIETYSKYGVEQLYLALNEASKNNFKGFTNSNSSRTDLINNINYNEIELVIKNILNNEGYETNDAKINFYELYAYRIQNKFIEKTSITR